MPTDEAQRWEYCAIYWHGADDSVENVEDFLAGHGWLRFTQPQRDLAGHGTEVNDLEDDLATLGKKGWELVSHARGPVWEVFWLKRPAA